MSSESVDSVVEDVVEELVDETRIRANSIGEYLSPFGLITTKEFILRLLFAIGAIVFMGLAMAGLSGVNAEVADKEQMATIYGAVIVAGILSVVVLVWFLFATVAKDYRTYGMPLPVIFALATPFLPFLIIIKFLISSKVERRVNQAVALKQREFREQQKVAAKAKAKRSKIPDRD